MQCPRCQHGAPSDAAFCPKCGAKLSVSCPQCGTAHGPDDNFCRKCGQRLANASAQGPGVTRFASPDAYTPKHLAEKILTSKAVLEGERKQVTVLFADLKGSMELLADRDPEEARKLLDPVLERLMEAVHRYEGTVNQVMGDGIMALFGAPLAHEDHAVRACYAALRMHGAVRRYAEDLRRSQGLDVQIRVGLNSGEVVVRSIGSDLHMDYTAVGQTTHLAARMEQLARPGATLVTGDTLRLCEGYVQVNPLGPTPVKGLSEPVDVYELTGARAARTRFQAAAARGLTRFVGRDAEVEQLRHALERAAAGHGQVVAIVGEAGVGKSRLFYEFTHSHRVQGWLILESGSVSYGKATAYLPVIDLLKEYFKIQERDGQREIRAKVIGRVLGLDRSLEPLLPPVLALLDVPVEDPGWEALDPSQRRQRTLEAVKRLLLRESQVQPLVVVIEDLHWVDSETQALLDSLVDSLGSIRVLLLVNYRPEYEHRWGKKTYYTQLRLESLPPESTSELLRALLGDASGLEPLTQMLRRRGNPFFLEETVRTLVETKALEGEPGAYRLVRPVHGLQIPATVQAILAARIDRLAIEEKQLLQTASVIGKDVPSAILTAIADLSEEALRRALGHLQEAEFLYETTLFPDLEYTFKHALTHEVTYGSLLQDRRRPLHGRIVETIERLYPERLPEHIERLAHHAFRGEAWEKAVTYLQQAGAKAFARSSNREALAYFEQALAALTHLPETRETQQQAIDLRFDLQRVHQVLGEFGKMLDRLREAEAFAEALGDHHRLGRLAAHMARCYWWRGEAERAVEQCRRAQAMAADLGDRVLAVMAGYHLGIAFQLLLGGYREAIDAFQWTLTCLEGQPATELFNLPYLPAVVCRAFPAWCHAERGEFSAGLALAEDAIRVADAAGHPESVALAYWAGAGQLYLMRGQFPRAVQHLERAMDLVRHHNFVYLVPWVAAPLGQAYALTGRATEGVRLVEEAVERSAAFQLMPRHPATVTFLSEALCLAGRFDDALRAAERALALTREHQQAGWEAYALRSLGDIQASDCVGTPARAETAYTAALALADQLGMRPLQAHCHLGLGKLYRRAAKEHLTTAMTMYREMDMGFWLEQAEAARET